MKVTIDEYNMIECSKGGVCDPFYLKKHGRICSNCPLISFIEDKSDKILSHYEYNMIECSKTGVYDPSYLKEHSRICSNCPLISFIEDKSDNIKSQLINQF